MGDSEGAQPTPAPASDCGCKDKSKPKSGGSLTVVHLSWGGGEAQADAGEVPPLVQVIDLVKGAIPAVADRVAGEVMRFVQARVAFEKDTPLDDMLSDEEKAMMKVWFMEAMQARVQEELRAREVATPEPAVDQAPG